MDNKFIPLCIPSIGALEAAKVQECMLSTFVSSVGKLVTEFEEKFAEYVGSKYAVACSSGTAAIHLALLGLGLKAKSNIVVPNFTFIASVNPVAYIKGDPIFLDAEPFTFNPDTRYLNILLHEVPKHEDVAMPDAFLGVHLYGMPMDLDEVIDTLNKNSIPLIEDATESLGAKWNSGPLAGKYVGTVGKVGCFSFNGNKIITSGGGGMVVTDDEELAMRIRHLSTQARDSKTEYSHDQVGYNYRMTNLHASLGLAQLERLPEILERKKEIAEKYTEAFKKTRGIMFQRTPQGKDVSSSNWMYTIVADPESLGVHSRDIIRHLAIKNIQSRPLWTPISTLPMYENATYFSKNNQDISSFLYQHGLNLPCSYDLTDKEQDRVIKTILEFIE